MTASTVTTVGTGNIKICIHFMGAEGFFCLPVLSDRL